MWKMPKNYVVGFIVIFLFLGFASSTYISDAVLESHGSTGRSLLQTKKNCQVNFEKQNYTVLTSQCKGPKYTAEVCCKAFKEFACPFAEEINDLSTNCAETMFSYIHIYGSYPAGTFASLCKESKNGLECSDDSAPGGSKKNSAATANVLSSMAMILISSLVSLFSLL